ncbi:hypothetical protein OG943_24105 [Amycolatopsis sp. NBC_00345]|uniref:8-oxoguanine DNA glycosylase OGG fold protein n=1 Tax=Amycolatopsis sp. NBC_00345 TaxID=2975955 RepID=UPI002E2712BD
MTSVVRQWREHGEPPQPASRWSRDPWLKLFPGHHAFLDALPDGIDRAEATRHAERAVTPEGAELAFLVAMIWGYGRVGYGAWRTARVLAENPHAVERLAEVALVARDHGGRAAFRNLADEPLRYLGVAFGTKYLRFVTTAQSPDHASAPILDAVVRRWLATHADLRLNINEWRPDVYEQYVDLLTSWSTKLDLATDTVEELIFRSAISQDGSAQWAERWAGSDEPATPTGKAQATLLELERLFDTADAGPAEEARPHLDELAQIIQRGWAD